MPYIPQFNRLSLQEMSYAPTLMRQQHDDAVAKQMELAEALKFDYLKQDAPGLEPILQKYNKDIEDVSKQIAEQGFSHDLKNKVMGLRSQYVGDEKIRHYKKQYTDAMSQWDELRKRMIQAGRPGDDISRQKERFFSEYTGGYDPDGKLKNEFTAGRTSGYYDIVNDVKSGLTNLGKTGTPILPENASVSIQYVSDPSSGQKIPFARVVSSTPGQNIENANQIESVLNTYLREYSDKNTDRGLFADISKFSPEYIASTIKGVAEGMRDSYYQGLPHADVRFSPLGDGSSKEQQPGSMPEYNLPELKTEEYGKAEENLNILSGGDRSSSVPRAEGYSSGYTPGWSYTKKSTNEDKLRIITEYKNKYPGLFKKGVNEIEAAQKAAVYDMAYAAKNNSLLALKSKDIVENLYNSLVASGEDNVLKRASSNGDKGIETLADLIKTYEGSGIDWKQIPPLINPFGETFLRDLNGNLYSVNESAFDRSTQELKSKVIKPVMSSLLDPKLFDKGESAPVEIPGGRETFPNGLYMDVDLIDDPNADPYNVEHRIINIVTPSGNYDKDGNPLYYKIKTITPGEAFQELTEGQRSGYQTYVK